MNWIQYDTGNRQEIRGQSHHIPPGPYILIDQHRESEFLQNFATMTGYEVSKDFKLSWGKATYAVGFNGPIKVGYWYDTSD